MGEVAQQLGRFGGREVAMLLLGLAKMQVG
jgi:hypothetical protein